MPPLAVPGGFRLTQPSLHTPAMKPRTLLLTVATTIFVAGLCGLHHPCTVRPRLRAKPTDQLGDPGQVVIVVLGDEVAQAEDRHRLL